MKLHQANISGLRRPPQTWVTVKDQLPIGIFDEATIVTAIKTVTQNLRPFSNPRGCIPQAIRKILYDVVGRGMQGLSDASVFADWKGERLMVRTP